MEHRMGIKERKDRERREMKELILEKAKNLFLNEGFKNVSIRRIADLIEYSPATIYLYFNDKNEILLALQNAGFEELIKRQKSIFSIPDPIEKLRRHADVYISFALENPEYYDLMFIMKGPAEKIAELKKWETGLQSYQILKENVGECLDTGKLQADDLDSATFAMWALVHGIASLIIRQRSILLGSSVSELRLLAGKAVDIFFNNLRRE
jgi:AcrR family transcriptional regulator